MFQEALQKLHDFMNQGLDEKVEEIKKLLVNKNAKTKDAVINGVKESFQKLKELPGLYGIKAVGKGGNIFHVSLHSKSRTDSFALEYNVALLLGRVCILTPGHQTPDPALVDAIYSLLPYRCCDILYISVQHITDIPMTQRHSSKS